MPRPNLFHFASSELSQDAFICWLLAWAEPDMAGHNQALHTTAHDLIRRLLLKHQYEHDFPLESIDVRRQYNNMDIVAVLNREVALLIEDKVHATAHSGQLGRYRATLAKEFGEDQVFPIYFKTGDQSSFERARENGYEPFVREEFLEVLEAGLERGVSNGIFRDYYEHLLEIDEKVKSFEAMPVTEWPQAAWKGFFLLLQERLGAGDWKYVPNQSGGFMGYYWHFSAGAGCTQYLQLEREKLCFKIAVEEESNYKSLRRKWHERVIKASKKTSFRAVKPGQFGHGEHMTVAIFPGDYRVTDENEIIDVEATLQRLQKAEEVLTRAVEE